MISSLPVFNKIFFPKFQSRQHFMVAFELRRERQDKDNKFADRNAKYKL